MRSVPAQGPPAGPAAPLLVKMVIARSGAAGSEVSYRKNEFTLPLRSGYYFWLLSPNHRNSNGNANGFNLNSNRTIQFTPVKYLIPIAEKYPELKEQLEASRTDSQQMKKDLKEDLISRWYTRPESNRYYWFRKPTFYPLNYGCVDKLYHILGW